MADATTPIPGRTLAAGSARERKISLFDEAANGGNQVLLSLHAARKMAGMTPNDRDMMALADGILMDACSAMEDAAAVAESVPVPGFQAVDDGHASLAAGLIGQARTLVKALARLNPATEVSHG